MMLTLVPSPMIHAGPREALWHAYMRLNAGATHDIVGPSVLDLGHPITKQPMYHPWHAQKLVQMSPGLNDMQHPLNFSSQFSAYHSQMAVLTHYLKPFDNQPIHS